MLLSDFQKGIRRCQILHPLLAFPDQHLDNWVRGKLEVSFKRSGLVTAKFISVLSKQICQSAHCYIFHAPVSQSVLLGHAGNDVVLTDNPPLGEMAILRHLLGLLSKSLLQ